MPAKKVPSLPIYLDNAASTPMDQRVINAMVQCLGIDGYFGNSASKDHVYGWQAAEVVEKARDQIATCIGCSPLEIIFTSGATESNNLALRGLAYGYLEQHKEQPKKHLICSTIEHKAVLECAAELEKEGFNVTYLSARSDGSISPEMLAKELREDTLLVSISQANSVLGTINDMHALAELCHSKGVYYHSDCAQSNGLLELNLNKSQVDMVSLTPEKIYGPKGIGALYLRKDSKLHLQPLIVGGGHEKGLRGGTLATHQIAAMGEAFAIMHQERKEVYAHLSILRTQLVAGLEQIAGAQINGSKDSHLPGIVSVSFKGINGQYLLPSLHKVACSTGSACSSKELKPSYVLSSIGLDDDLARASLRLSIGRFTTREDITQALAHIKQAVESLRIK